MQRFIVTFIVTLTSIVYAQDNTPERDRPFAGADLPSITVTLREGWNQISINVSPPRQFWTREEGPDVRLMTEQLRIDEEHHHIIIMKDSDGQFYAPRFRFNSIQYWDLTHGYQIGVDETIQATWFGESIAPNTDIPLEEHWNIVPYYPRYLLDASAPDFYVLSRIIDHVLLAKDPEGHYMAPRFNFSNMLPWQESQGYQIRVNADVVLNYPPERENNVVAMNTETSGKRQSPESAVRRPHPTEEQQGHWRATPTAQNMSLLVNSIDNCDLAKGSQVAAFSADNQVVGAGFVDADGRCGLAVWGDDISTDEVDGLRIAETFTLKLWDAKLNREFVLTPVTVQEGEGLIYEPDGLSVLEMAVETTVPYDFYLSEAYPNPFNSTVRLSYGLPEAAFVSISVYDVEGRLVETIMNLKQQAGYYTVLWNSTGRDACATSGIYFIRMSAGEFRSIRKVTLVK